MNDENDFKDTGRNPFSTNILFLKYHLLEFGSYDILEKCGVEQHNYVLEKCGGQQKWGLEI